MNKQLISTYTALVVITLIGLLAIKEFNISYPLTMRTSAASSDLSVVGEGKVEIVPDLATINVGFTTNNVATAEEAQKAVDTVNNELLKRMTALGIPNKDVQTSNYSINPNYDYTNGTKIAGYNASANITIKTKDIPLVGKIVSESTAAGANQINGVQFSVENPDTFREAARKKAIENAKEQAEKLAKELGIRLGDVTNVIENSPTDGGIMYKSYAESAPVAGGGDISRPDIQPGSQEITSTVTLFFEKR